MRISPPAAYIDDTGTLKGRGVFASRAFMSGEVVEVCPVVLWSFSTLPEQAKTFVFSWETLAGVPNTHALALGYGSMYNHGNPANLRYEADREHTLLRFVAVRSIAAGEELTINYNAGGGSPETQDNDWFDRMKIKPVVDT